MDSAQEREAVREGVRRLLAADRAAGVRRSPGQYARLFPGFEDVIEEEAREAEDAAATRLAGEGDRSRVSDGAPSDGERVAHYRLIRELGRGGMGIVHLAEDERLRRRVALKVLSPQYASSVPLQRRFRREAEAAGRIDHPGLCAVYEADVEGKVPYIAMRYVEGKTLQQAVAESRAAAGEGAPHATSSAVRLPGPDGEGADGPREGDARTSTGGARRRADLMRAVRLVERTARALHVAHEAGLVHRDVKPANVMVTPDGEPVLLDFGLARAEDDESAGLTQTGVLMGTPAYMSPEQLTAQRIRLDRRTDVYSLGATLYEAVTLRMPFEAPTLDGLYQKILATDPENPRRLNPSIPEDLRVVLDTALEKDRARRYQTALDFAEDLRRVREMEPIRARPVGAMGRLGRWARRNPALAAATASAFAALSLGLGASLHLLGETETALAEAKAERERAERESGEARQQRERADGERRRAEEARSSAEAQRTRAESEAAAARSLALVAASREAVREDWPLRGLLLAREAVRVDPTSAEAVRQLYAVLEDRERPSEIAILRGHGGEVRTVALLASGSRVLTAGDDGTARLWTVEGTPLVTLGTRSSPAGSRALAVFPAGDRVLVAAAEGRASVLDVGGRRTAVLEGHLGAVTAGAFSPDGARILTGGDDGTVRLWDAGGAPGPVLRGHVGPITAVAFSPSGERLATASRDGTARLWDREGAPVAVLRGHDGPLLSVAFSPDGSRLLTTAEGEWPRLWDAGGRPVATLRAAPFGNWGAAFTADGAAVVGVSPAGGVACRFGVADGAALPLRVEGDVFASAVPVPGGAVTLLGSREGAVSAVDADGGIRWRRVVHAGRPVVAMAVSSEGATAAVLAARGPSSPPAPGEGDALVVIDARTGEERGRCAHVDPDVPPIPFAGGFLATSAAAGLIAVDAATGSPRPFGSERSVTTVLPQPAGDRFVVAYGDGTAEIRDADGNLVRALDPAPLAAATLVASTDLARVVAILSGGEVVSWDAEGRRESLASGVGVRATAIAVSPDGARIAVAFDDASLRVRDLGGDSPGERVLRPAEELPSRRKDRALRFLALSGDGSRLCGAVGYAAGSDPVAVWDVATGRQSFERTGWPTGSLLAVHRGFLVSSLRGEVGQFDGLADVDASGRPLVWQVSTELGGRGGWSSSERHFSVWRAARRFVRDGREKLLTVADDRRAWVWDYAGSSPPVRRATLGGHQRRILAADVSPEAGLAVTGSEDGTARLWGLRSGGVRRDLPDGWGAAFAPRGDLLALRGWRSVLVHDLAAVAGAPRIHRDLPPERSSFAPVVSASGTRILAPDYERGARLFDSEGRVLATLRGEEPIARAVLDPAGERILTVAGPVAVLWDSRGAVIRRWTDDAPEAGREGGAEPPGAARRAAVLGGEFAPSGGPLAVFRANGDVEFVDGAGRATWTVRPQENPTVAGTWSGDGRYLVARDARYGREEDGHFFPSDNVSAGAVLVMDLAQRSVRRLAAGGSASDEDPRTAVVGGDPLVVAVVLPDGGVEVRDLEGRVLGVIPAAPAVSGSAEPVRVVVSQRASRLAVLPRGGPVGVWTTAGEPLGALPAAVPPLKTFVLSPDGAALAGISEDGRPWLWPVGSATVLPLAGHPEAVAALAFSPDGATLATACDDGLARLFDSAGTETGRFRGDPASLGSIAWTDGGAALVLGTGRSRQSGQEGHRLYRRTGERLAELSLEDDRSTTDLRWDPRGELVLVAGQRHGIVVGADGGTRAVLRGHGGSITDLDWSPTGDLALTSSRDGTLRLWRRDGAAADVLECGDVVKWARFLGPDRVIAFMDRDGVPVLWERGEPWRRCNLPPAGPGGWRCVAAAPGGEFLVTRSNQAGPLQVRSAEGAALLVLPRSDGRSDAACVSGDGRRIVAATTDGAVGVWDRDGTARAVLRGHDGGVSAVAVTATGDRVATRAGNGVVRLWREDGGLLAALDGPAGNLCALAFDAAGRRLLVADYDVVRIWDVDVAGILDRLDARPVRGLTEEERARYAALLPAAASGAAGTAVGHAATDAAAARAAAERGDWATAADAWEEIARGEDPWAWPEAIRARLRTGDGAAALPLVEVAVRVLPGASRADLLRGIGCAEADALVAEPLLRAHLSDVPGDAGVRARLLLALQAAGRRPEADELALGAPVPAEPDDAWDRLLPCRQAALYRRTLPDADRARTVIVVTDILSGFQAEGLGIRPGDVILEIQGRPLRATADFADAWRPVGRGTPGEMRLWRDGVSRVLHPLGGRIGVWYREY